MNRPRLIRGLGIAWSVWWGILCMLLLALWVRSYRHMDDLSWSIPTTRFWSSSIYGRLAISWQPEDTVRIRKGFLTRKLLPTHLRTAREALRESETIPGFVVNRGPGAFAFRIPYWLPVINIAALATAPWLRWHFRLRTLLIATTVMAVVLGLVVWVNR
jgi:hypothetical protein